MFETSLLGGKQNSSARAGPESFFFTVLICLALPIAGAIGMLLAASSDNEVASRQQVTAGKIVVHQPRFHNRYGFRFHVGDYDYAGWEIPSRASLEIGQSVTVYYDSLNPAENSLTDFAELSDTWRDRAVVLAIMVILLATGAFLIERVRGKSRMK